MTVWQEAAAAVLIGLILLSLLIHSAAVKARDRKWRDAERKLTTVLQPRETVKAICPQKRGRVILTSRRLLWETREGFTAVNLKNIKRVQGSTKDKKTTSAVSKMVSMTVKGPEEYIIRNSSEEFSDLAKKLQDRIRKQNQRKKQK